MTQAYLINLVRYLATSVSLSVSVSAEDVVKLSALASVSDTVSFQSMLSYQKSFELGRNSIHNFRPGFDFGQSRNFVSFGL